MESGRLSLPCRAASEDFDREHTGNSPARSPCNSPVTFHPFHLPGARHPYRPPFCSIIEIKKQKMAAAPLDPENAAGLLEPSLAGDPSALTRLVAALTPVIQARVARTLLARRHRLASGRD